MSNNVNVIVSGPNNNATSQYKTLILKSAKTFKELVTLPNTKYVIRYDFDLNGETITIPTGSILEFDGGMVSNGTLVGLNTKILNLTNTDSLDVTLEGTFEEVGLINKDGLLLKESQTLTTLEKDTVVENILSKNSSNGMGRVILKENIINGINTLTLSMIAWNNTIYVIQYNFTLGDDITIPENCVLEFEGGSINGNTNKITFNNTLLNNTTVGSISNCRFDGTIANDYIDVTHYGMSTTLSDCSTVFNDIMNILKGKKRQKVYISAGKYTSLHPYLPCSNIEIYGDGIETILYNAQTSGPDKHIFVCNAYPAWSTGAAHSSSYTKFAVNSISNDRRTITVESGHGAQVGNLSAVFGNRYIQSGTPTDYYLYVFVGKIENVNGNSITFDEPLPVSTSIPTDLVFAPKASGLDDNAWYVENVHVHDMYLSQATGVTSGYYAIASGYRCVWENLKIHSSTPVGSNLAIHCIYRNIDADCEAGMWDDAELSYDNLYENITITRFDSRLSVIPFNVTGGGFNHFRNIHLIGGGIIGGVFTSDNIFENIEISDYDYSPGQGFIYVIRGENGTLRNLKFKNCSLTNNGAAGSLDNMYITNFTNVEGVEGNISCTNVTPRNRLPKAYSPIGIMLNKEFHIGTTKQLTSARQSTSIYPVNTFHNMSLTERKGNNDYLYFPCDILHHNIDIHSVLKVKRYSSDDATTDLLVLNVGTASPGWKYLGYNFPIPEGATESEEMTITLDAVINSDSAEVRMELVTQDYKKLYKDTLDLTSISDSIKADTYVLYTLRTASSSVQSALTCVLVDNNIRMY